MWITNMQGKYEGQMNQIGVITKFSFDRLRQYQC